MEKAYYPKTIEEALEILKNQEVEIIAGGTDIMLRSEKPDRIMFLEGIKELKGIEEGEGNLKIGAGVTMTKLLEDEKTNFLKETIKSIASPGIRNWGTLGGNICNASPIGDLLPVLYALDGVVEIVGRYGKRSISIEKFILGRKKIDLRSGELVKKVTTYKPQDCYRNLWFKVGGREANALSKVNLFSSYKVVEGKVIDFRLAIGGVSPVVIRDNLLEKKVIEKINNSEEGIQLQEIFDEYKIKFSPIDDKRSTSKYKVRVIENIFGKTIEDITEDFMRSYKL